jgi:peptidylprolyl isomerase
MAASLFLPAVDAASPARHFVGESNLSEYRAEASMRASRTSWTWVLALALALLAQAPGPAGAQAPPPSSLDAILKASPAADWRTVDPENTLYLTIPQGRIVIELAPEFAPSHVANIKRLVRAGFFDGLFVVRAQDNYVVQWGDADSKHPTGGGQLRLKAEFDHPYAAGEPFVPLPDPDTYAPQTGFSGGFPAARDPATGLTWLTHCYGMVGAGRDVDPDSGGGPELYAVIGHAPRQLDRNVTLVGRVIQGMDIVSALPRGHGDLGFYQTPAERIPIQSVKVAADLPPAERTPFQALRADSETFARVIQNRRFRRDPWFKVAAGHIDVCNVPLPVRVLSTK